MSSLLYQVDAFTDTPFTGNPAAVCVLSGKREVAWMQNVAAEMNLSETAFLRPEAGGGYRLRWFTPTHEVDLCGHATLASAHVLWTDGFLASDTAAEFNTNAGRLTATRNGDWTTMEFPTDPVHPIEPVEPLLNALGIDHSVFMGQSERDYLVHCPTVDVVRTLSPDLSAVSDLDCRGVIVTAKAGTGGADFVSRFFAPGVGVPEDPVTGSAHCALGPYWAEQTGICSLTGRQISARGGIVYTELDTLSADRVKLSGRATLVTQGRLLV